MPESSAKKRRSPIPWRPPADRWDEFDAMVAASGLVQNAFITEAVFGRNRHRPGELKLLAQQLRELGRIAEALRQFERSGVAADCPHLLEMCWSELRANRSGVMLDMGRKP